MKVILQEDVKGQGKKGQLIEVSDGYARNYLIPRKLAVQANDSNIKEMNMRDKAREQKTEKERRQAGEALERIQAASVVIHAKGGAGGRLFGSVTTKEISDALMSQFGISVDKHKLSIDENIKTYGTFEVKVKLYPEVSGSFYATVTE